MKPREFDDLVRQKFDRNDFEYNPAGWDRLADQLDGNRKKRSILMWWLMPVSGIAASVALAVGIAPLFNHSGIQSGSKGLAQASQSSTQYVQPAQDAPVAHIATAITPTSPATLHYPKAVYKAQKPKVKTTRKPGREEEFAISYDNAVGNRSSHTRTAINLLDATVKPEDKVVAKKDKKKPLIIDEAMTTFKDDAVKKPAKLSIIVSGGYNNGNHNNGYAAGATIRKAISEKVFIEGDVAFASSNIQQNVPYRDMYYKTTILTPGNNGSSPQGKSSVVQTEGKPTSITTAVPGPEKNNVVSYNLAYVQISPSVSYRIVKRLSVGAGPDFQQVLSGTRPEKDATDIGGNFKTAPLFDVGMIGKTEFSVTKTLKAGLAYRKGINNVLTPMNKYIDRDYVQVQVKCAIFNK